MNGQEDKSRVLRDANRLLKKRERELEHAEAECKRMEETLWESEKRYRRFFAASRDCVYITSADGQWIDCSDAAVDLFGYSSRDELFLFPIASLYADPAIRLAFLNVIEKQGYVEEYPVVLRRKDGTLFDALVTAGCRRDANDAEREFYGTIRDVSRFTRVREELRRVGHIQSLILDNSLIGVGFVRNGRIEWVNRRLPEMFGQTIGDVQGASTRIFFASDESFEVKGREIDSALRKGGWVEFEIVLKRADGTAFMSRTTGKVLDPGNPDDGSIWIFEDITTRKKAEDALKASERRLKDIIDFSPDATLAIDRDGGVIIWNRAIEEMTGVSAAEMLGKADYEYAVPFYGARRPVLVDLILRRDRKDEMKYCTTMERKRDHLVGEFWVPCLKGSSACLWAKAGPLYDHEGNIVGAIESARDITNRKHDVEVMQKREKDLELKTRELEDVNTALRVMLKQREGDRSELGEQMLFNVKLLVQPYIEQLKRYGDPRSMTCLEVMESNLQSIVSPFSYKLSSQCLNLTNREVQVANLIKEGKTTKEIVDVLHLSASAVNVHRYHIRKKLGLKKMQNLRSYLASLA
jgi:PAS domain S-box-containing protein